MNELTSLLVEHMASRAIDWVAIGISDRMKQRKINALLEETRIRAAMVNSSCDLMSRFNDKHLVEELLSHHVLMDITKDEAITRFLDQTADETAKCFVSDFYDSLTSIMATADSSIASRKALEAIEDLQREIQSLRKPEDNKGQLVLLGEVIKFVASGTIGISQINDLIVLSEGTFAATYLKSYYALCTEGDLNISDLEAMSGNDALVIALCSVAISAERIEDASEILGLCSFDAENIIAALDRMFTNRQPIEKSIEIHAPESSEIAALVELINFEYFFGLKAYSPNMSSFKEREIAWNPLAAEKLALLELTGAALYRREDMPCLASEAVSRFAPWFPKVLVRCFKETFSIVLANLREQNAELLINSFPEELQQFAQTERAKMKIRVSEDMEELISVLSLAEEQKDHALLIDVACRMIEIDRNARNKAIEVYRRCKNWAFPTGGTLYVYAKKIEPEIAYEQYCDYGKGKESEVSFHFAAYEIFKEKNPSKAEWHIEEAIKMMSGKLQSPDLLYAQIWVPYLVGKGRKEEVKKLVDRILPLAPIGHVVSFLGAISDCEESDHLFDYFIEPLVNSSFCDSRSAELIARELAARNQEELAGRIALAAFKKEPTETLALLAAQWLIRSSLEVDRGIVRFAEQRDTAQMNLLLAHVAHDGGMRQKCNSRLLRAAFSSEKAASRALVLYAMWNVENEKNVREQDTVAPNTYVTLTSCKGQESTYFFIADCDAVRHQGAEGPAGTIFDVASDYFLLMRGCRAGDTIRDGEDDITIVEVGAAESALSRAGFKEMASLPEGMVLTGTSEEAIETLTEIMRGNQHRFDLYLDGYKTQAGRIYYGIETGAFLVSGSQLEFTISAICDTNLPFRRNPISRNTSVLKKDIFLLSYNTIVILSLLDLPDEITLEIKESCVVSESTARRLIKDVQNMVEEPYRGAGRLGFNGERLVMYNYNDEAKRHVSERGLAIKKILGSLEIIPPSLGKLDINLHAVLGDNEVIDIQTAADNSYIYVTEDILESQLIDACDSARRCSLATMFIGLSHPDYVLTDFSLRMANWGAQPVLEADLAEAAAEAINSVLEKLYKERGGTSSKTEKLFDCGSEFDLRLSEE